MSDNLALWNSVEKTNPAHTKQITGKAYQGNSPKPHYLVHKATETFGPCGIGWGFTIEDERIEEGAGGDRMHIARVKVWFKWNGERGEVEHVGGTQFSGVRSSGKPFTDEDAPKKSVTDALVKALSLIGFAGDIFMGRFDDSKYVSDLRQEIAAEARAPKRTMAEISAAKQAKEALHSEFERELAECTNLVQLDRFTREWAHKLKGEGGHVWTMQEKLEKRREELNEPGDDEPHQAEPQTRAEYIQQCHAAIADAESAGAIMSWWSSDKERAARRQFSLSPNELNDLKERVATRRQELGRSDQPYATMKPPARELSVVGDAG